MSENGEIYTTGKNFTLPPAVTAWTNSTSAHKFLRNFFSNIAKGNQPISKYELNCARIVSRRPCKLREIGRPLTFCKRLHLPTGWSLQQSTKGRVASNSLLNIKPKREANPICENYPQVAGACSERKQMFHGGSFLKLADDDVWIKNPKAQNWAIRGF